MDKIEATKHLNIYIEVWQEEALSKAQEIDEKISSQKPLGKLFGAVFSIKDVLLLKGKIASAGSKMLSNYKADYTATVIKNILDEDAIIIGRVNCDEFAMGSSTENAFYGATKNPLNEQYISGGSSGGSAASVAADTCLFSLGSDTGGSVRQPASFCHIYGLKPTYGTFSRYGLIAYASSFDQVGILAHHAEDIAFVFSLISEKENQDFTQVSKEKINFPKHNDVDNKFKIALPKNFLRSEGLDPSFKKTFLEFIEKLRCHEHIEIEEVQFNLMDYLVPTYYIIACAEASSNLSRFDGIRYGHYEKLKQEVPTEWERWIKENRSQGLGVEVKRRILMGNYVLSSGFYDAYYKKALKARRLFYDEAVVLFSKYDVIISPTTPHGARKIGDATSPVDEYLADIYTVFANLVGIPAMNIPFYKTEDKLSMGVQLMAGWFNENKIFQLNKIL